MNFPEFSEQILNSKHVPQYLKKDLLKPSLQSLLPIILKRNNGKRIRINNLELYCSNCSALIMDEFFRGSISDAMTGKIMISGVLCCLYCRTVLPLTIRIKSNLKYEFLINGRWIEQGQLSLPTPVKRTSREKIKDFLESLFKNSKSL